jgi:hypothetical protein
MFGMTPEDKGMLVDIHNDQQWLIKEVKAMREEAVSEEGYKRCVRRKAAVDTCQEDIDGMRKSFRWVRNVSVTGFVGLITVGCAAAANFMLGK